MLLHNSIFLRTTNKFHIKYGSTWATVPFPVAIVASFYVCALFPSLLSFKVLTMMWNITCSRAHEVIALCGLTLMLMTISRTDMAFFLSFSFALCSNASWNNSLSFFWRKTIQGVYCVCWIQNWNRLITITIIITFNARHIHSMPSTVNDLISFSTKNGTIFYGTIIFTFSTSLI